MLKENSFKVFNSFKDLYDLENNITFTDLSNNSEAVFNLLLENSFSGMDKKRKVRQKKKILLSDKYY